ncbi:uncharacterized protein EHS24_001217 [Apiotrichum porosum]|uniref:Uncharacterized protein n=1 Tax=Apiotrichum porosum TaxID=105984 RepID=A0A427XK22_9TREE|nr:uncharacterized protein EHS24_001217 [Apiotrichum porosum]RSH79178.1 hypothetical protein EHS24_001217 [Apiotrichum porosum]
MTPLTLLFLAASYFFYSWVLVLAPFTPLFLSITVKIATTIAYETIRTVANLFLGVVGGAGFASTMTGQLLQTTLTILGTVLVAVIKAVWTIAVVLVHAGIHVLIEGPKVLIGVGAAVNCTMAICRDSIVSTLYHCLGIVDTTCDFMFVTVPAAGVGLMVSPFSAWAQLVGDVKGRNEQLLLLVFNFVVARSLINFFWPPRSLGTWRIPTPDGEFQDLEADPMRLRAVLRLWWPFLSLTLVLFRNFLASNSYKWHLAVIAVPLVVERVTMTALGIFLEVLCAVLLEHASLNNPVGHLRVTNGVDTGLVGGTQRDPNCCVVCQDREAVYAVINCGHLALCQGMQPPKGP